MDTALVQTLAAGVIVAAAALFLGRRAWHALGAARRGGETGGDACGTADGACGCGSALASRVETRDADAARTGAGRTGAAR